MQEAVLGCKTTSEEITYCLGSFFHSSAVAGNDFPHIVRPYYLPLFLLISVTRLFFSSSSSFSAAYLHVSTSPPSSPENNSIHKLSGHVWWKNHVNPFSVISRCKFNKQGCCVGSLWTQRTTNGKRENGRENKIHFCLHFPKKEGTRCLYLLLL